MIKLLYFASVRERMGCGEERLYLPAGVGTVGALAEYLQQRNPAGAAAFAQAATIRAAVNQVFAQPATALVDGDEVAFFPPVTGG